jgi:hypothetical protein
VAVEGLGEDRDLKKAMNILSPHPADLLEELMG